ncbi:hypothetical protein BG015_000594 [Linnemannia schmuckeri]|uniref:Uncharacterized protein n=1 Tax=Linnemannia schmuckeri TaxID=64567 RepID=A0A9P5RTL3_9FUNG|nr:hypothetical protein BG015_000594 [Linnemannia schmuckeri]
MGCPVEIEFRVQYSDLAQLKWVQLQVLGADNSLMIEGLDNSTRAQWDNTRTKTVTWTVPNSWPSGDYIIRVFGNASYPCQHGTRREYCTFALEDRETFHLHPLAASQGCPLSSVKPSSPSTVGTPPTAHNANTKKGAAQPVSGNSGDNYIKSSQDLLNKNLAQEFIDQSVTQRIQDQTILKVLDEIRDYSLQKSTLTLKTGDVIPMADRMDSSTITRFVQTLELSNSTFRSQTGGKGVSSIELVTALHKNSSLVVIPPASPSSIIAMTIPFNHTEFNPFGRTFIQGDQDQIQDKKSNDASFRIDTTTIVFTAAALVAVVGSMTV